MQFTETQVRTYFSTRFNHNLAQPSPTGEVSTICPLHADRNPSFSINLSDEKCGVWYCHTCGIGGNLYMLEMALTDGEFREAAKEIHRLLGIEDKLHDKTNLPLEAEYRYRETDGSVLYTIQRFSAGQHKTFRVYFMNAYGTRIYAQPDHLVLYHLDEVVKCDTVYICEGEKKADHLRTVLRRTGNDDIAVTCSAFGAATSGLKADRWKKQYSQWLKGKTVYVFPDRDENGEKHVQTIIEACREAKSVRRINLPVAQGEDVDDFINGLLGRFLDSRDFKTAPLTPAEIRTAYEAVAAAIKQLVTDAAQRPVPTSTQTERLTDMSAADLFVQHYKDFVRYDHQKQSWLRWAGHWWTEDTKDETVYLAMELLRGHRQNESRSKVANTLTLAESCPEIAIHAELDGWNQNHWLMGTQNGVVDLRTGELRAGQQTDRITLHADIPYDPAATCPRWIRFLDEIFGRNEEIIDYVWKALGYTITGSMKEQKMWLCFGHGSNGKNVFLETVARVFGDYAKFAAPGCFEANKGQSIPSDMAMLADRRLIVASEVNKDSRLNEQRIKSFSHGDPQVARFLNKEFFEFQPQGKLWYIANHKPRVHDESDGFWRSLVLIPFTQKFVPRYQWGENGLLQDIALEEDEHYIDDYLARDIEAEHVGILTWLVQGCLKYQKEGLAAPHVLVQATAEYQDEADALAIFLSEYCEVGSGFTVLARELYERYEVYASDYSLSEKEKLTGTKFGREMSARFRKQSGFKGKVYHGIRIRTNGEADGLTS